MSEQRPTEPTRPEPPASEESMPFWEATKDGVLLLQWCTSCDEPIFFPRALCPKCLGDAIEWRPATGRGSVYAMTTEHRAQDPRLADRVPYVIALIDLEEGVRMMSNVVGCEPSAVFIGMDVTVTWERLSDGRQLPLFTPSHASPG